MLSVRSKPSSWLLDTLRSNNCFSLPVQEDGPTLVAKGFARLLAHHDGQIGNGGCPAWSESIEMRMRRDPGRRERATCRGLSPDYALDGIGFGSSMASTVRHKSVEWRKLEEKKKLTGITRRDTLSGRARPFVNRGAIHSYLRLTAHTHRQIASGQGGCHQQEPFIVLYLNSDFIS